MPSVFERVQQKREREQALRGEESTTQPKSVFERAARKQERQQGEKKDSWYTSLVRTLYQIPSGILQAKTWPLDIWQMVGMGLALDPEEMDHIRKISEREGIPFDEEKYRQSVMKTSQEFPTQSNLERLIERKTGAPLTPKTKGQKLLKLSASAGKFAPGTLMQKATAAVIAPAVSEGLEAVGVPEPIAELVGLGTSGVGAKLAPKKVIKQVTKPSGLPVRRFEKIKKPREVPAKKIAKIHEKLEGDFRKISDEIISDSPISKTKATLEENPAFKAEVGEQFKRVEELAEKLTEKISSKDLKKTLMRKASKKEGIGFTPSEYDKDYKKFMRQFAKETPVKEGGARDLVAQYRKNNKSLSEAYDPSSSRAFNRAKRDALLDYNRDIADVIESKYPNSEFSKLFKETNKQWAEISDAEAIDKFINGMFDGEVKFKKGRKFFENANEARPFKRALGEENFPKFEQLMKDMLSTEKPAKMLKVAKQKGFSDLVETAGAFIIHPTIGKLKLAYSVSKEAVKSLVNASIDKPQLMFTWEKGLDALKKGDFKAAEKSFNTLNKEVQKVEKLTPVLHKEKALKRFIDHKKKSGLDDLGGFGKGISDSFYDQAWEALQKGKSTVASNVKDPFIESAKVQYDKGLIKTKADLKNYSQSYFEKLKKKPPVEAKPEIPKKVFHGTQTKFEKFEKTNDIGFHFSESPETAKEFALGAEKPGPGHVIEAELKIKNPLRTPDLVGFSSTNLAEWLDKKGFKPKKYKSFKELVTQRLGVEPYEGTVSKRPSSLKAEQNALSDIKKELKDLGYDSIVYENVFEGKKSDSYIVFDNKDIKQKKVSFKKPKVEEVKQKPIEVEKSSPKFKFKQTKTKDVLSGKPTGNYKLEAISKETGKVISFIEFKPGDNSVSVKLIHTQIKDYGKTATLDLLKELLRKNPGKKFTISAVTKDGARFVEKVFDKKNIKFSSNITIDAIDIEKALKKVEKIEARRS